MFGIDPNAIIRPTNITDIEYGEMAGDAMSQNVLENGEDAKGVVEVSMMEWIHTQMSTTRLASRHRA